MKPYPPAVDIHTSPFFKGEIRRELAAIAGEVHSGFLCEGRGGNDDLGRGCDA